MANRVQISFPYEAPTEYYIQQALLDSEEVTFGNEDQAKGLKEELMMSKAFSTIATAIAAGDHREELIQRYVSTVKKMISQEENMPSFMGGLDSRGHCSMAYGMVLLWNDEAIMEQFTEAEKSKLITMFKAMLISTAYTLNDYDDKGNSRLPQRIAMNGDTNNWNGSGVNYWEPNLMIFYSASFVLGLENIKKILKNYNHLAFISELDEQGLISIKKSFEKTRNFLDYPSEEERLAQKAAHVEAIVKNQWAFKGVTLEKYIRNPMKMYQATQNLAWDRIAQDGDYIGQRGMAHEFDCHDNWGSRQSAMYVSLGIDPSLQNRVLMHYFGVWDLPENKAIRKRMEHFHRVGVSDYYAKTINGYYTQSWMGNHTEYVTSYIYIVEQMSSMKLFDEALFHDTFSYYEKPEEFNKHWIVSDENFNIVRDTIIPHNIKYYLTNVEGVQSTDPAETVLKASSENAHSLAYTRQQFTDMRYLVWVKGESQGEFGLVGRVQDENNYYKLSYENEKISIQRVVCGQTTVLAEKELSLISDTAYRFKGVFEGDTIEFHIDGQKELGCTDGVLKMGGIGVLAHHDTVEFDAVLVQANSRDR